MDSSTAWGKITMELLEKPREFKTVPSNGRTPLWFYATITNGKIIIDMASNNTPSSNLKKARKVSYSDFEKAYNYYDRWSKGETWIRQEVRKKSRNTAYIFSLIKHIVFVNTVED